MDVENISASGVIEICDGVEEKTSTKWTISSCDRKASEFYETFFKDRKKETGTSKKLVEEKSIERCFNISKLIISDRHTRTADDSLKMQMCCNINCDLLDRILSLKRKLKEN